LAGKKFFAEFQQKEGLVFLLLLRGKVSVLLGKQNAQASVEIPTEKFPIP